MPATQTRTAQKDALRQLEADGRRSTIRARYARLLYVATHKGFTLNDERRYDVTDAEAAHILGCKVSTICGRRNELSGGVGAPVEYQDCPVVTTSCRRRSRVADSGTDVTAFKIRKDLFD
jgi:hypothetical protein